MNQKLDGPRCAPLDLPGTVYQFGNRRSASEAGWWHPPSHQLYQVKQVHGCSVLALTPDTEPSTAQSTEADALVTTSPGQVVAVRTADCVPVLVLDPVRGAVAAIHAGWRGTVAGVIAATIELMVRHHGCLPARMIAAVGPSIGPCHFEVGEEVAERFVHLPQVVRQTSGQAQPRVDLPRAVTLMLEQQGIAQVANCASCTYCRPDLYFSYRRDGQSAGRQLSFIGMTGRARSR